MVYKIEAEIYYFSGTGNSLVIARDIAEKINSKITNSKCNE